MQSGNGYLRHVKVTVHGSLAQFLSNFFSHDVEWFGEKRGDKEGMWKRTLFFFWGALPPVQRLETVMRIFGDRRGWKAKDGNIYVLQAGPYSEQMGNRANCLTVDCNSKNLSWTIHCAVTQFTSVGAYLTGADITPPDDSNDGVPKRYAAALWFRDRTVGRGLLVCGATRPVASGCQMAELCPGLLIISPRPRPLSAGARIVGRRPPPL